MDEIKHLLPKTPYFKANLHTHSTISDGTLTPEEAKEAYKALGYQILCLTDHNIIVNHSDMNDPNFLILTGMEINVNAPDFNSTGGKTYHLNLIAKEPNNLWCPAKKHRWFSVPEEYDNKVQYDNMVLQCNPDSINNMIAKANEKGFLVMYNHPTWSCQTYPDYAPLKGLWGMEVRNSECCMIGHNENNFRVYKDLLTLGNKIFPLGADDMHSQRALGQSWIMVGAKELSYSSVIEALEKGDFYMSCGPEIVDLSFEGIVLKVACSNAQSIRIETCGRYASIVVAENEPLREATFQLEKIIGLVQNNPEEFFYITITAPDGSYAITRPYYLKDLL